MSFERAKPTAGRRTGNKSKSPRGRDRVAAPARAAATSRAAKAPRRKATQATAVPYPPALVQFMMTRWQPPSKRRVSRLDNAARFKSRRQALSKAFAGETLIIPTGHEKIRANDAAYPFRPGSDFYYLTGNLEPDCVLVLAPRRGGGHDHILYVEPNPGRSDATFFTDRVKGELWVGPRLGVEQSLQRYRVDRCAPLGDLPAFVKQLRPTRVRLLRGVDAVLDGKLKTDKKRDAALAAHLGEMRLLKDAGELKVIEEAGRATRRGFEDIIRALPRAKTERQVEGAFWARARQEGNDVGYNVIAAAGANACILHWNRNDGPLRKGELLLVDAGVESNQLYTADVTRTLPINGRFSRTQREVYDLVIAAQDAAFAAIRPGAEFLAPHRAAMEVLARGLERLGILPMSADEALEDDKQYYKRYTLHGVSHMLGLDVHDCAAARTEAYRNGRLRPGMVLTVEPGLYFQRDDLTVPAKYRGIGIRIEDDVVVTSKGCRLLTRIPRTAAEVEQWMHQMWQRA